MNYYNYFTEVEEYFVRRRGKHLYVSPLDWSLIATWRDSGVPLNVALRGIDIAMDSYYSRPRRRTERPGTLFYCHDAVMAEYARHLDAHVGEHEPESDSGGAQPGKSSDGDGPDKESILRFLNSRIGEIDCLRSKLQGRETAVEAIERVAGRLREIVRCLENEALVETESVERDLGILEGILIAGLRTALPEEKPAEWEQEARKDLKLYKKRLPKETYEKILENFLRTKVHRHFNIGELSLFHF